MTNVLYIVLAVLVLLFMVTVHELGHYVSGKLLGFKINEFAVGFGPALWKRTSKKTGEVFSLRIIPLGGFCAFEGEDEESDAQNSFDKQKPWKRIIVLASGALMNFITALLIAVITITAAGIMFPKVAKLLPDSSGAMPAQSALEEGDILLSVEGKQLYYPFFVTSLTDVLQNKQVGDSVSLTVLREGQKLSLNVEVREYASYADEDYTQLEKDDDGDVIIYKGLGILRSADTVRFSFVDSVGNAFIYCFKMAWLILGFLYQLVTGAFSMNMIGGPITTIGITAQTAQLGIRPLLEIVMLIGVNLAVFNLLPIPALDGSRIMFTLYEGIRGKPVKRSLEAVIHLVGLVLLFGFVILADVLHFIG